MMRCPLEENETTKLIKERLAQAYTPNLKGFVPEQAAIDASKRMVSAATKDLPTWQRVALPKNWPTWVKVGVAAGVGAALKALGVSGSLISIVTSIFGG